VDDYNIISLTDVPKSQDPVTYFGQLCTFALFEAGVSCITISETSFEAKMSC